MKKNEMTRRILAVLLAFVLTLGLLPTSAFAARIVPDEVQITDPTDASGEQANLAASYHGTVKWSVSGPIKSGSSSGVIDLGTRTGQSWNNVSYRIPYLSSLGVTPADGYVVDYVSVAANSSGHRNEGGSFLLSMSGGSMVYYLKQTHTHSYTNFRYYSTQPTCYVTGTAVYSCSCGQTTTQTVAKLSADYTGQSWVNQGNGTEKMVCRNCNGGASGHSKTRAAQVQNVTVVYMDRGSACDSETVAKGNQITIADCTNTYTGHEFLGWSTSSTATEVEYEVGEKITLNADTIFYAVWEGPNATFTLKKVFAGGVTAEDVENFSMDYSVVAGTHRYTTTLNLNNCASINEDTMTATWNAPYYYNMGANNAITVVEHGDVEGYSYTASSSSGSVNNNTWTFTVNANISGATRTITNTYTPDAPAPATADYTVRWVDLDGNDIKALETRKGIVGDTVSVTSADKSVKGWDYAYKVYSSSTRGDKVYPIDSRYPAYGMNKESDTLAADGSTKLVLVFKQNIYHSAAVSVVKKFVGLESANDIPQNFRLVITRGDNPYPLNENYRTPEKILLGSEATVTTVDGVITYTWDAVNLGTTTSWNLSASGSSYGAMAWTIAEDGFAVNGKDNTLTATTGEKVTPTFKEATGAFYFQFDEQRPELVTADTWTLTNTYTVPTAKYQVQWYDTNGNAIKAPEGRDANVGSTVEVSSGDKIVSNYDFVAADSRNVTSATMAASGTVLKLYFQPKKPTGELLYNLGKFTLQCQDKTSHKYAEGLVARDSNGRYNEWSSEFATYDDAVTKGENGYTWSMTIHANRWLALYQNWHANPVHTLTDAQAEDIVLTFTWNAGDSTWELPEGAVPFTIQMEGHKTTYTWKDEGENGHVWKTATVSDCLEAPTYDNTEPTKDADDDFTYEFDHWDGPETDDDGNKTYTAVYNQTPKTPVVTPTYDLYVNKEQTSKVNGVVTYAITVKNQSDAPIYNLMLVDTMDKTLTPTVHDMSSIRVAIFAGDDTEHTNDLNANNARVRYLGTQEAATEPERADGKIVWNNQNGGLTRKEGGKTVWDFTWKVPGELAAGEELVLSYNAQINYPTDGSSMVAYYNYADAVAGTAEGDDPFYDGGEQASLLSFIGGGSGAVGGGSGPVGGKEYKYTLTYDFNGGTWNEKSSHDEVVWSEKQYHYFTALDATVLPTKAGHRFVKWQKDGADIQLPLTATEEDPKVTVVAVWEEHDHTWTDKTDSESHQVWADGKAPTCTEDGVKIQECTCGATQEVEETDSKLGHIFEGAPWVDDNTDGAHNPECTSSLHYRDCTRCEGRLDGGREFENHFTDPEEGWTQTKAPNATEPGEETRKCPNCDHVEKRDIAPLGQKRVIWVDENGTDVLDGPKYFTKGTDEPAYAGKVPTKDADDKYTYEFTGWTKSENGDNITYTAIYTATEKPDYAVTWKNGDETVAIGTTKNPDKLPAAPEGPEAPVGKEFVEWGTPEVDHENHTITIQPVWKDKDQLTVKWVKDNGEEVDSKTFFKGDPEPEQTCENPSKPSDASYNYTFKEWIKTTDEAGNITYTATYTRTAKSSGGGNRPVNPPVNPPEEDLDDPDVPLAELPTLNQDDHFAYIIGKPGGTIQPLANITRAEVVTIFFRIMTDEARQENWGEVSGLSDVAQGVWYNHAVCVAVNAGLIKGLPDGTFAGNQNITRAEFATIAARFLDQATQPEEQFTDIQGHWAEADINRASVAGWIKGVGDGKFNPDAPITRAEVMTLVNRMLNRKFDETNTLADMIVWPDNVDKDAWYYGDVQEATNDHEYDRKAGTLTETWTKITQPRDWSELEK